MAVLDGPLSHVLPVLWCHRIPPTLTCTIVTALDVSSFPYLCKVTLIWQCHVSQASIWQFQSKRLAIDYSDAPVLCPTSAGDALALSAAWIEAFPEVKFTVDDVILSVELQSHPGM
ncbi:hypothetical protein AZE42_11120 [Rhizopogon vesiculosus]|uniref:Uncharacterized protein n=1 Tax=Rhizopogon vesiculosus TaxID=180088 RepID=A0A1J8Q1K3_9AGAM|nr:hypothetical protein AZE42_11120 [Rhizopogon vesiculosus]